MNPTFITEDFLLQSEEAKQLYHKHAKNASIVDYHNHLSPKDIAENRQFSDLTEIWLEGDHYKWRAMRINGIDERYCTGNATPEEKFVKWAETVPKTMRNPLYHWTHLELQRYFGVTELLNGRSARKIYEDCSNMLQREDFRVQGLLAKMKAEVVCTTDDPCDDLHYHEEMQSSKTLKMLPTFRPDKAYTFAGSTSYAAYVQKLAEASSVNISSLQGLFTALENRVNYFHDHGCRAADHGLETLPFSNITEKEAGKLFVQALEGHPLTTAEAVGLRFIILSHLSTLYHSKGWVQQFHLGALRNNNDRMLRELGPDTGFDSIGDFPQAQTMARYFNHLDSSNQLAKTILYNLNPADNELFATMTGNFNDGTTAGKMQWGSGWWYLDQKDGMEKQMNTLSNMGLLSVFVGMVTDSRSFLSFPRHEYFRRILCNLIGEDVKNGELPNDMALLGQMVEDVCYNNAKTYFGF
ncbi:MAG: glucuronate isomerase [Imperialibacter sp.]|uniref:glucuronate isomerase n=1 Tax=Imperialibacter sp. TaxID=2038411 RepID=UPI003A8A8DEB